MSRIQHTVAGKYKQAFLKLTLPQTQWNQNSKKLLSKKACNTATSGPFFALHCVTCWRSIVAMNSLLPNELGDSPFFSATSHVLCSVSLFLPKVGSFLALQRPFAGVLPLKQPVCVIVQTNTIHSNFEISQRHAKQKWKENVGYTTSAYEAKQWKPLPSSINNHNYSCAVRARLK